MKLRTSFVDAPNTLSLPLAAALWLVALACFGSAFWLALSARDMHAEMPVLRARIESLEARARDAGNERAIPTAAELSGLRARVATINALSPPASRSTTGLLALLERTLPDGVELTALQQRVRDGEVLLIAESRNATSLTSLLESLERIPRFTRVLLSRQVSATESKAGVAQVEIRLTEAR